MAGEGAENGRDDMIIDGSGADQQRQNNLIFDGVNVNYLKLYYGKFSSS